MVIRVPRPPVPKQPVQGRQIFQNVPLPGQAPTGATPQRGPAAPDVVVGRGPELAAAREHAINMYKRSSEAPLPRTGNAIEGLGYVANFGIAGPLQSLAAANAEKEKQQAFAKALKDGGDFTDEEIAIMTNGGPAAQQAIMNARNNRIQSSTRLTNEKELARIRIANQLKLAEREAELRAKHKKPVYKTVNNPDGSQTIVAIGPDGLQYSVPSGDVPQGTQSINPTSTTEGKTPSQKEMDLIQIDPEAPLLMEPPEGVNKKEFLKKQAQAYSKYLETRPEERRKAYQSLRGFNESADISLQFIDDALKIVGDGKSKGYLDSLTPNWAVGVPSYILESLGLDRGSTRADLVGKIGAILDAAAFQELQQMRENSKTGGAVGQLTENERIALGNIKNGFNANMSSKAIRAGLLAARERYLRAKTKLNGYFQNQFGLSPEQYETEVLGRSRESTDPASSEGPNSWTESTVGGARVRVRKK